jgi:ABC-type lipoprotein export system ATPase subunit
MADLPEITGLPRGARFFRADLHIHSVAASHDVRDTAATPEAIVATAAREGLHIIAISDHNEIGSVPAALAAAAAHRVFVVPAIELSTPQGHLLCYLPDLEKLQRFFAQIDVVDRHTPNSRCQNAMLDCLGRLQQLAGFGILAHVDADTGFEVQVPGASPHKSDVICHRALLGVELKSAASTISYSASDPDPQRAAMGRDRITRLQLPSQQFLARVLNSDSHTLAALGRNASGDRRVTRYKMNALTFESLRIALEDSDARVRIEDEIPLAVPYVRGIRMSGGFLDAQAIHFGPNLNCIIGGRGTGKSTTFEAIRCLTGQPGGTSVVDSDVWPNQIDLLVQDQAGQIHSLSRARDGDVINVDDPLEGPVGFAVECYGQGETQQISQKAQTDPAALLVYFDRFIDIRQDRSREEELRKKLLELQSKIEEAAQKVELIPQYERNLAVTQAQIKTVEQEKAKDIITRQRKLEQERQARATVVRNLEAISKGATRQDLKENVAAVKSAANPDELVVGRDEFAAITVEITIFERELGGHEEALKASAGRLSNGVMAQIATWRAKDTALLMEIEQKKRQLEAQGIRVDMAYLQKLAVDEARLKQEVTNLKMWVPHLAELRRQRRECLRERWAARGRITDKRAAFAQKASAALRDALSGVNVSLKFEGNAYSPEAAEIISSTMLWRTVQVPRASALVEMLTVPKLLEALGRKDPLPIQALTSAEGMAIFTKADAIALIERLSADHVRFRLERAEVSDLPHLTVTRLVSLPGGKKFPRTREFRQLSLGQQQSVLLALMLSADTNLPLIIDQPEDNLDSEFIYQTIVPVLRRAKERRQVIVVAHNPNIAVLGDAEQIVVLGSNNERAIVTSRGSIDDPDTRAAACSILEGSREAFARRARIYGVTK